MSHKLPLGEASALTAFAIAVFQRRPFVLPAFYLWYLGYFAMALVGLVFSSYRPIVLQNAIELVSVILIAIAAMNLIGNYREQRTFVVGYLILFALYPVRGAVWNYVHGITNGGRIAWNFFFSNPNDLAIACCLPIGLCGYLFCTERGRLRYVALIGLVTLVGTLLLTASRGAMIGMAIGIVYLLMRTRQKVRTIAVAVCVIGIAAALAPDAVWNRVSGLTNASLGDMSKVDPEGSASGRWAVMGVGAGIAMHNPVVGVGIGAYGLAHARATQNRTDLRSDERGPRDAHSTYIRTFAETGFPGGICIIMFMLLAVRACRRARLTLPITGTSLRLRLGLLLLESSMIAYSVAAIFNSAERSTYTMWQFIVPFAIASYWKNAQHNATTALADGTRLIHEDS